MRALIALVLALVASVANAEPEKTYNLQLTQTQVLYIGKVLGQQPYNDVAQLLLNIQKQIDDQNKPAEVPPNASGK